MKTMMRFLLVASILATISSSLVSQQWEPANGPLGSSVNSQVTVVLPFEESIMLVTTSSGIYRSTNDGESWVQTADLTGGMFAVVYGDGTALILFGSYSGLYESYDYGFSWNIVKTFPRNSCNSVHVIEGLKNGTGIFVGDDSLFVSYDFGETWVSKSKVFAYQMDIVRCREKLFAPTNSGLFFSTDDGANWTNTGVQGSFSKIISFITSSSDTILFASGSLLCRSTDLGSHWTNSNINGTIFTIGQKLYIKTDSSLLCSTDVGNTWTVQGSPLLTWGGIGWQGTNTSLGQKLFIGWMNGIVCTNDNGLTWHDANKGLNIRTGGGNRYIGELLQIITNGKSIILVYWGGYFENDCNVAYLSIDGSCKWNRIPTTTLDDMEVVGGALFDDTEIYLRYGHKESGFFRSSDSGKTWNELSIPPGRVLLAHEGNLYAYGPYVSTDRGNTWQKQNTGLSDSSVCCYALVHDQNLHYVFAGTQSGVFVTSNNGSNWKPTATGPTRVSMLAAQTTSLGKTFLFAGTDSLGVFRSSDLGMTWYSANAEPIFHNISKIVANQKYVFCLSSDSISNGSGVFCSGNNGSTWRSMNAGFPAGNVRDIAVTDSLLYACFGEKGLWCLPLSNITTVLNSNANKVPRMFVLHQNYPNPFNPNTTVEYQIPQQSIVTLRIFDILGREVAVLVNEKKEAGRHSVQWDAARFSSGVYFYALQTGQFRETKRMVLMK